MSHYRHKSIPDAKFGMTSQNFSQEGSKSLNLDIYLWKMGLT